MEGVGGGGGVYSGLMVYFVHRENDMSELKSDNVENFIRNRHPPYDGTGNSVYIPTLLINKDDGERIK